MVSPRFSGRIHGEVAALGIKLTHDHICAFVLISMSPCHRPSASRRHKECLPASARASSAWTASQVTGMLSLLLLLLRSTSLVLALHLPRRRLMGRAVLIVRIALWLRHDRQMMLVMGSERIALQRKLPSDVQSVSSRGGATEGASVRGRGEGGRGGQRGPWQQALQKA